MFSGPLLSDTVGSICQVLPAQYPDMKLPYFTLECFREENYLDFSVIQPLIFPQLIKDLLNALPNMFLNTRETHSALGPALQAAFKLMSPTGGRVSVFQTQLPSLGAGLLQSREDPNQRSSTKVLLTKFLYLNHWCFLPPKG